jgi:hypothetical protein
MAWQSDPGRAAQMLISELADHIVLPDAVQAAVDKLDAIIDPPALPHDHVAQLIADGASDDAVQAALLAAHLDDRHRQAIIVARQIAGQRVINAVRKAAPEIHALLKEIALPILADVLEAGRNGHLSITTLIKEKRVPDAELRAELPELEVRLRRLYELRNQVWNQPTGNAEVSTAQSLNIRCR